MSDTPKNAPRRKMLTRLAGAVALSFVLFSGWYVLVGSKRIVTDNAYVGADSAEVMPLVSGQVASITVDETQAVREGDVLLTLVKADAEIRLRRAEAQLEQARRSIQQARSKSEALRAQLRTAEADLARTTELAGRGNASQQNLQHAQDALRAAQAELDANQSVAGEGEVDSQPSVMQAQADLDQARLDLERTVIKAPISGIIAKRNVQVGQYLNPGTPVMAIVPVQAAYVDANFKESQLARVRIGQDVELVSDIYGGGVTFHGKVIGIGGGTGSAFALIPAQNATGNWIKIVQRVPVRISLDPAELEKNPLRVGMSMEATIDLTSGAAE